MNKKLIIILVIVIVLGGAYYGYTNFFSGSSNDLNLTLDTTGSAPETADVAGAKLIALLEQLQGISMNSAIFSSPQFASLHDESSQIIDEPKGRNNPFAPYGTDAGFVPSADLITSAPISSTTSSTSSATSQSGSKPVTSKAQTTPVKH